MTLHPQDIFDVYGDYSHIHPVSVGEAVQKFRQHYKDYFAASVLLGTALKKGESTVETRKASYELWKKKQTEVEILLFRSIMGEGA